jgi:hypothetical protein
MQKPGPRDKFASEAEEREHILNCLCWIYAEQMSPDVGLSPAECADAVKQLVLSGRFVIDIDVPGDRVRLTPAPSLATH